MQTKKCIWSIIICLLFSFASCDPKDEEIDVNQLLGQWAVTDQLDILITYTFRSDKTCSIRTCDSSLMSDTTVQRTYIISYDNMLITLYDDENKYTEQYHIIKLTSEEMKWENASPKDGNYNKKLEKVRKV